MQCTRLLGLLLASGWATAGAIGCTVGAPPGFSGGDSWTFPLVGPLEDGLLITPVTVAGHGPYLFAFDPDANFSAIDKQVVDQAQLRTSGGPKIIDETDTGQIRLYAELVGLKVSGLTIDRRDVMLFPVGFYDTENRHISGILGRDLIADSLVFGFDRDQGVATLSTIKTFTPPPGAIAISYKEMSGGSDTVAGTTAGGTLLARSGGGAVDPGANVPSRVNNAERAGVGSATVSPVPRRLANVQIGDASLEMHLDLGAAVSQMPEGRWAQAHLAPINVELRIVDEAASVRRVTKAGIGDVAKPVAVPHVTFAPYIESRFGKETVDGALGLDFFRGYAVFANWDKRTFYLKPRGDKAATLTARLGRWSAMMKPCPHPGCVQASITAGASPMLDVARDAEATSDPLEVLFAVTAAAGKEAAPLLVELPRGVLKLSEQLPVEYQGASLTVLDVSPFPRACVGDGGCVLPADDRLARGMVPPNAPAAPGSGTPPPGAAPPGAAPSDAPPVAASPAAPARNVALDKLKRVSGEPGIPPSADARKAAGGKPFAVAIVKVCLSPDGKVDSTKVIKSSGVPAYDEELQTTIKASWAFAPDAKPEALCTSATFGAR